MFPSGFYPGLTGSGGITPPPSGNEAILMSKILRKWAVYWGPAVPDDFGHNSYQEPIQIRVRWEDVREEYVNETGEEVTSSAKVYADRDLEEGGVLWLGLLEDITDEDDPFQNDHAFSIKKFSKVPNLKSSKVLREAML